MSNGAIWAAIGFAAFLAIALIAGRRRERKRFAKMAAVTTMTETTEAKALRLAHLLAAAIADKDDDTNRTDLCEYCGNAVINNSCDCGRIVDVEKQFARDFDKDG